MPSLVAILLLAAALTGLLMLWFGWRGRRLNDHPVCGWCRFDLHGVYPDSVTCPECGAGLKRDGAVRIGVRRRSTALVLAGAMLAAMPIVPFGAIAWAGLTGTNIDRYKPLGVLLWESRLSDSSRLDAIADEIMSRAMARRFDKAQYARVIDAMLDLQADHSGPWSEKWGDLHERAKLDGVLTKEQDRRFIENAGVFEIVTRPAAHPGMDLPVELKLRETRVGSATDLTVSARLIGASIDARPIAAESETNAEDRRERRGGDPFGDPFAALFQTTSEPNRLGQFQLSGANTGGLGGVRAMRLLGLGGDASRPVEIQLPADTAIGTRALQLDIEFSVGSEAGIIRGFTIVNGRVRRMGSDDSASRVSKRFTKPIAVVPEDQPLARPIVPDESTTAALSAAMKPESITVERGFDGGDAAVSLRIKDLPAPVAFDVYCRVHGREWPLGTIDSSARRDEDDGSAGAVFRSTFTININGRTATTSSDSSEGRTVTGPWKGGAIDGSADIILRPSAAVAGRTIDLDSYYDAEITFKDVPVVPGLMSPFTRIQRVPRGVFDAPLIPPAVSGGEEPSSTGGASGNDQREGGSPPGDGPL
jgi:hypothetical protein